jgi:hypothetical protein
MEPFIITLSTKAAQSFLKDLRSNRIAFQTIVEKTHFTHFGFLEDSPKLQMAIRMVKERFGSRSISISSI